MAREPCLYRRGLATGQKRHGHRADLFRLEAGAFKRGRAEIGRRDVLEVPPNVPIAVRTGSAKTTERDDVMLKPP